MKNVLDKLNWRYATKKFDSSKKINKEDFETLLEAARMTASSYGLQPYHILVIEDLRIREKLKKASWDQAQITDASHLIILANNPTFDESLIDAYIDMLVEVRGVAKEDVAGYAQMMKGMLVGLTNEQKASWTSNQTYIVLGNLLNIAAEMEIDVCPIEGFDNAKYNDILGLANKNLNAAVAMTLGYRSVEDKTQHYPKVRYSREKLITHI